MSLGREILVIFPGQAPIESRERVTEWLESKKRSEKMILTLMKSKIHRATVTQADLNYVGSLTIDADLMDAAGIQPHEMVYLSNLSNAIRIVTYAMEGPRGSGII